jgi:CRP-like cAMP-binding protein
VGFTPHEAVMELIDKHKSFRDALWRESLVEAACFREWVLGIGQRRALERIAHVFCEMAVKAKSVQLSRGNTYDLPLTQSDLADATGLTPVHVNRTIAKLKKMKLITLRGRALTILDWESLVEAGGFDSGYLHRQLQ